MATLTHTDLKVKVLRAALEDGADPNLGPGAYGPWTETDLLVPLRVVERLAPGYHTAKFRVNPGRMTRDGVPRPAWEWRDFFAVDDMLAIVAEEPGVPSDRVFFVGFIIDVDLTWDRTERLLVTAASRAFRLARDTDHLLYGRYMMNKTTEEGDADAATLYSGLPCTFNAEGRPNRHPTRIAGDAGREIPVFTWDGDPDAELWTLGDLADYVAHFYNGSETWVSNFVGDLDFVEESPVPLLEAEGLHMWEVLGRAAKRVGWDCFEEYAVRQVAPGYVPASSVLFVEHGEGPIRIVKRQDVLTENRPVPLDLEHTNLFAARIAENVTGCVTRPVLVGGRRLYEITVDLEPGFDLDDLPTAADVLPDANHARESDYAKQYVVGGDEFGTYRAVGRLWVANEDGAFSAAPYGYAGAGCTVLDPADVAGETAGSWPLMPLAPRPMLTRLSANEDVTGGGGEIYVEYTLDDGSNWYPLEGCRALRGRLGVYLTVANLAGIVPGATGQQDVATKNFLYVLADSPSDVQVRLTCTVAAPQREYLTMGQTWLAGTRFGTGAYVDRGAADGVRTVATGSAFGGAAYGADIALPGAELYDAGVAMQADAAPSAMQANLPLEWPEEPVYLADRIAEIGGIGYSLDRAPPAEIFPRVVQRTIGLVQTGWYLALALEHTRLAGIT